MKIRSLKNYFLLIALAAYIVLYKLFIFQNYMKYSEIISASFLIVLLGLSIKFLGFRKDKSTVLSKNVMRVVIFYLFLVFFVMYGLGIIVGFLKNAYSRSLFNMFDNICAPVIIIITIELFRYVFISANKDKKFSIILLTILTIAFEIATSIRVLDTNDLAVLFNTTATIILPSIFKNILMSYMAYNVGYKVPIVYRLVMDIYIFLVPIIPSLGDYVNSMILISLPILIYISSFSMVDDRITRPEPILNKSKFTVWDVPVAMILITLIALISGFFPLYMIGIGSQSMDPTIHKGDAVILKKVTKKTELKKGDIVAYSNGRLIIVHRIVEVKKDGKNLTYITKGDNNNGTDPRPVSRAQVKGTVKFKIPIIAWPTVWLTELFNS